MHQLDESGTEAEMAILLSLSLISYACSIFQFINPVAYNQTYLHTKQINIYSIMIRARTYWLNILLIR